MTKLALVWTIVTASATMAFTPTFVCRPAASIAFSPTRMATLDKNDDDADVLDRLTAEYGRLQDELLNDLAESQKKKDQAEKVAEIMLEKSAKLKQDYSHLQDELMVDLAERDKMKDHGEQLAEDMFKIAADMAALKRYHQMEAVDQAERELQMAHEERQAAEALNRQAHDDFVSAQDQVSMLESSVDDQDYEGQERLRDMSVAHAAHHLEEDSKDRIVDARFHELEAEEKRDEATDVLKNLEQNEQELKAALKDLYSRKMEKNMEQWNQE